MGFNEFLSSIFGNKSTRDMKEIKPWVEKIKAAYPEVAKLDNDGLRAKTEELKEYIRNSASKERAKADELRAGIENVELEDREEVFAQIDKIEKEILEIYEKALDEVLPVAFSIVKESAKRFSENEEIVVTATDFDRTLAATKDFVRIEGDKAIWQNHWNAGGNDTVWNMVHYDVQLFGGVVLHKGKIAEMATGEGKTLVATLPVFLNALTGNGVHVVTVNDYLAKRDSEWMGPLYMFHGLSVDCIDRHQPNSDARRQAYLADITFGTNNEFGFDYLRDNMAISPKDLVQRQHNYAIVDEVDSVLIDDARTPLIISGPVPKGEDQLFDQLRPLVERLVEAQKVLATKYLSEAKKLINSDDKKEVEEGFLALFRSHKALPKNKALIKFLSEQGIKAGMLKTEEVYMEQNNKRMHEATDPLYFVIDEKLNSVDLTDKGVDLITGNSKQTAKTEEQEFIKIYGLPVLQVPTNKPIQRKDLPDVIFKNKRGKYKAVVREVERRHATGQPMLIGTTSIEQSEELSHMLDQANIPHSVLNAKYHEREAAIVALAGQKGAVTIATNMAGRGTDISLGEGVAELGGLAIRRDELAT